MDNQNEYTSNDSSVSRSTTLEGNAGTSSENSVPTNGADDMLCLMDQEQKTCILGKWMKCMRKPALSMQYTLAKRHIPDMDNDSTGKNPVKGANEDSMSVTGDFTIRYFDLAAGAMLLLLTGCTLKGLCRVRRWM